MTKYRITKETTRGGVSRYLVQESFGSLLGAPLGIETSLTAAKGLIASLKAAEVVSTETVHEE